MKQNLHFFIVAFLILIIGKNSLTAQNCPSYSSTVVSSNQACGGQIYYFEVENDICPGTITLDFDADYGTFGSDIAWYFVSVATGDTIYSGFGSDGGTLTTTLGPIWVDYYGQTFQLYVTDSWGDGLDVGAYIDINQGATNLVHIEGNFGSQTNQGFAPAISILDAYISINTPSGVVNDTAKYCKDFKAPLTLNSTFYCNTLNVSMPWEIRCVGSNSLISSNTHNVTIYPNIATDPSNVVDITWDGTNCEWDVTPLNDCDNGDIGSIFTITPDPTSLTPNACASEDENFTVEYIGVSGGPNCCSTGGPLMPINYTQSYNQTNVQVANSPFGGTNNSAYFQVSPNSSGGDATSLTFTVSMSGYNFPDPPGTATDDYWVTIYVDGNPIYDVQYNTSSFTITFNLGDLPNGYDENSVIEVYIYPNSFSSGTVNTTYIPNGTPSNEGEWTSSNFSVDLSVDFEEQAPTVADCDFVETKTTTCCTPVTVTNGTDNVCSGNTGSLSTWTSAVSTANPTCLVYSSVTPVAGTTLPDNTMPSGTNTTCAPITQHVSAYAYCDANGSGTINAGDTYTLLSSFDLTVNPAPPSLVTDNGGCGVAPTATLTCNGGTTLLSQTGTAPTSMPCGTGNNTTNLSGTFTATQIASAYGGADASCYSDILYNVTASCPQASLASGTDVQSACNTFTWIDGNTYTASNNTATHTITNGAANGCDSVVTLNLTLSSTVNTTDVQSACGSYTWIDGNTYTSSNNTATHTLVGQGGDCDTVVTLNLTINNPTNGTDVQSACNTFTWIDGNTYTASNNTATHTITNGAANGCDSVVTLNLTLSSTVNTTDVQSACSSYTWIDGNTYTSSNNTATHTLAGQGGDCDTVVTLNLTINNTTNGTDVQSACNTFTWIDGNTYTASNNTATHTITNGAANGCDSVVTLNLTLSSTVNTIDVQSACGSYTWIDGNTYTSSNNTATHTLAGQGGDCDTLVTLNLTINNPTNGTDVQSACNTFTWIDGNTYTASNNTATHTITNGAANGCDSVVTLNLTLSSTVNTTDVQSACGSYTWIDGNTYTSSNNTATHTLAGQGGDCDTVVTLNLTINNPTNGTDAQSACNSYTWIDGNTYTSSNNTATHTITNGAANGCDSIVTLNLTVNYSTVTTSTSTSCNPADVGTNMTGPFTMANGCDSTHYDTVSLASINVSAHASDTIIYQGNEIVLYSIGNNVTSYSWTANNNLISTDSSFTHTPNETATYYLLATNGDCEDVDSITIQVLLENAPLIPNSFTPNGDGTNDIFQVVNADKFKSVSIKVYNRWGEEVFSQNGTNPGWDGNFKLKEQPVDYYQYVISVESFAGDVTTVSGSLALFR